MKLWYLPIFLVGSATAQTPPMPPVVTLPMPAPVATATAGQSVTVSWGAVTQDTVNGALTSPVTYNLWNVSSVTAVLLAAGITATSSVRTNLAVGTPCYVVTASAAGDIDSAGSSPPACVSVTAAPKQVGTPVGVTVVVSP